MKKHAIFIALLCAMILILCGGVSASDVPTANFTSNATSGSAPLSVQFNDTSTGNAIHWNWDFGDNATSTSQNPTHTYNKAGKYNVSLIAGNEAGNNTKTQTNYITVLLDDVYVSPTGSDTTGDGTSSNPYATIQNGLNNVAKSGTIHLASGTYTGTGNVGLTITKNVNIVGAGQTNTIIDAQSLNRIFAVNSGVTVTIANVTLANGISSNGGAIYNNGNLTITSCTFTGNTGTSSTSQGGAISNSGTMSVRGCTFTGNTITIYNGGAIANTGTITNLSDCTFIKNKAYYGGAIYNTLGATIINLSDCTFTNNTATDSYGGTIYNDRGTIVNLSGCTFTGNTVDGYGAAIFNGYGNITNLSGCTFTGNTASVSGGALFDQGNIGLITGCNFTNNTVMDYGAAIYHRGDYNLTLSNCIFNGNTASIYGDGGAIYNFQSVVNVHFSSFVNNTAPVGSAIYSSSGTVNAQNNWWGSNNNPSSQMYGSVDYSNWLYMTVTVDPTTIANGGTGTVTANFNNVCNGTTVSSINPANGHIPDGTVVNFSSASGSFNPVMVITNDGIATTIFTAIGTGMATISATTDNQTVSAYINGIGTSISTGNVTGVIGNTVSLTATLKDVNGNAISGRTVTFTINGISYNATTDDNGVATLSYVPTKAGIYSVTASFAGDSTYGNCINSGSYLTVQMNDIYVSPNGSDITGDGTSTNPFATIQTGLNCVVSGGTLHLLAGTYAGTGNVGLTIARNVNIVGAGQTGTIIDAQKLSKIFTVNAGVTVTLANITLANGNATNGSAIYNAGTITINNCTFTGNNATSGGAIYNAGSITSLKGCTFTGNNAPNGGVIYNTGTITADNCTFTSNNASYGGVVYNAGTITINNCTFTSNTASSGGVVYNAGTINASGCIFTGNNAPNGGVIYNNKGNVTTLSGCTFAGNSGTYGGAIYNMGIMNVNGCNFTSNNATTGGAIYNNGGQSNLTVHFSSFANNTATAGSSIYRSVGTVNATNNWWGSNSNPSSQIYGTVSYSDWLYMTISVDPTTVSKGSTSNVTIDFNNVCNGNTVSHIDPANGHIHDGTVVNFRSSSGSFDPVTVVTVNGVATAVFTSTTDSSSIINATVDNQTLSYIYKVSTTLKVDNVTGDTGKTVNLTATLKDASGNAISGKTVIFTVNGADYNITTDDNGVAKFSYNITETAGMYSITASFTGDDSYLNCTNNLTSYLTVPLTVSANITSGYYNNGQTVALTTNDADATVYYSLNGGTLTPYTGPITINSTSTLSYVAIDASSNLFSLLYTQNYTIDTTAPTITANVTSGLYNTIQTVKLTANDDTNTIIYYTTDGTDPTTSSTRIQYTGPININTTTTLKYTAVDTAGNWATVQTQTYTIDTTAPAVTTNTTAGIYNNGQSVSLTCDDPDGTIYYTTDGTDPQTSNTRIQYTGPININTTTTLKYTAVDTAGNWAAIQTQNYIIDPVAPIVTVNKGTGTYNNTQNVVLTANDDTNTTIYYTTDGTDPTTSSTRIQYTSPININTTTTLKYTAVDTAGNWAAIQTQTYTIDTTSPTVSANKTSGSYNTPQSIALSSNDPTATIYYTTDGSDPATSITRNRYTGAISISSTITLKYTAVDAAGNWATVQTQTYKIDKTAPTASTNVKNGTYNSNKVITLTMSENGTIYYTLNGTTPTTASTKYTGPITISSTKTLKFIAVDAAGNKSPVYTATYTIDKTTPKVSAINPTNGATGVSRTKTVSIRLSENVLKGVNWSKVYIKNMKTGQKCKATIWISGNHIYITTNSKKAALTWYQVYIPASAIKDSAGNNLATAYTFKFKTGKT